MLRTYSQPLTGPAKEKRVRGRSTTWCSRLASPPRIAARLMAPGAAGFEVARADEIRAEQIRVFYRNVPALLVNFLLGLLLAFALSGVISTLVLFLWCAALAVVSVLRGVSYWAYRHAHDSAMHPRWATYAVLGAGASGTVWGLGGYALYLPESFEYQLLVLFVLVSIGAGAVTSLTVYAPAFYSYLPVSMLPITGLFLLEGDRNHLVIGIMAIIYIVVMSLYGRGLSRSFVETLKLRFENVDLLEELARKREEAERANVAKSKFLAAASHDLRQPLHALSLFTSVLDAEVKQPKLRRVVESVTASVDVLEKMFDVLLDVSRLDAGVLHPALRHFPLRELFRGLEHDFRPEAAAKGLAFECAAGEEIVHSDRALLDRILRNYVANAVRYTPTGSIHVGCVAIGSEVRIEVSDTGIGIPPEQQREIFAEFHQLENPERDRTKGLGLGLAIVDRVARLLGHPIGVSSAPGRGSVFSVTVPSGDAGRIATETSGETRTRAGDLSGLRVLVVDDDVTVRDGMRTLLAHWGCEAICVASENEAVAALAGHGRPDAIIADYRLRGGRNGVTAIARVARECGRAVPALIVTGDTAPERLREAKASGHQLAHKPVAPATLRAFLGNVRTGGRRRAGRGITTNG